MKARKYVDWSLLIGAFVEIRRQGQAVRAGYVEDAMPDSSGLWIASDANQPRQMFERAMGYEVWVTPQELDGDACYRMTTDRLYPGQGSTRVKPKDL